MSFGGILATALAGGAQVVGKQAGDDIEAGRKTDLMREQAAIEEAMRMRLAEFNAGVERTAAKNKLLDTRDFNASDETIAANDKVAQAAGKTARGVRLAELTDAGLNEAARVKAAGDARAASDTERELIKAKAGDKDYIKSFTALKLADPEVRAHIAQMNAAAGASAASVRESAERLRQLGQVGAVAQTVRGLQSDLAKTTDPEARKAIEQKITDLGFNGKDVKSFLSTAERAMSNGDAAMKILLDPTADEQTKDIARKQLARANDFAEQAAGMAGIKARPQAAAGPAVGTEVNGFVFKGGNPNDKSNWSPVAASKKAGMLKTVPPTDSMAGITFAGDGYNFGGQTYATLQEAQAARDKPKPSAMGKALATYGDD